MAEIDPEQLFQLGRAHALSAQLLYQASAEYADREGIIDRETFIFNGTFSPSVHYLLGLGAELMLKAAYVQTSGHQDAEFLRREIGHDLIKALDLAEGAGFEAEVENLREIVQHLRDPYLKHFFRYDHPDEFPLPDVPGVIAAYDILDGQLRAMFGWPEH